MSDQQHQQQQQKAKSIEELEKYWDDFSLKYSMNIAPNVSVVSQTFLNMVKIEKSQNILEIAVGPGYYVPTLIQRKNKNAKLYLTDLSNNFLGITRNRIDQFLKDPISGPYQDYDISKSVPFQKGEIAKYENINTELFQANSEELTQIPDNSIDTYISSLCLQLTENPLKMIQECYRVLQPGGKAIFSVWGDKNKSLMLSHVPKVFQQNGVQLPAERSNFHLNDKEKLIQMFKENKFTNIMTWDQFVPMNMIMSKEDAEAWVQTPRIQGPLKQTVQDEQLKKKIENDIIEFLMNSVQNNGFPLGLDTLNIIVQKQ